jgi:L-Lysine epsilon oxidase N-terminal/L-lysine epsilon oxidase C-terminal domain
MEYRIYPPIGVARLGNHPTDFYVGPETPGSPGMEFVSGVEQAVAAYKSGDTGDANTRYRVKRQAARFRIYEVDSATGVSRRATLPAGTKVEWSARLVNKKDAVKRPGGPPNAPMAIEVVQGREDRVIDSGTKTVSAGSAATLSGTYVGKQVTLGEIRTDSQGNLLVLGGRGVSTTYENAQIGPDFYNNKAWHDDVGDGPVEAKLTFADGTSASAIPAWVVVAPPDFAPGVRGVVTLYDRVLQAAISKNLATAPTKPSFSRDILPLLERATGLRWTHPDSAWMVALDYPALSDVSDAAKSARQKAVKIVRRVEAALSHPDYKFHLCDWQIKALQQFENADFEADLGVAPAADPIAAATLTRAVLDGTVGEGFYPGIEAGIIVTDMSRYLAPFEFRLDPTKIGAGDLTALMAQPWQADFKKCATGWWPSQRPNVVPPLTPPRSSWGDELDTHAAWAKDVMKLGTVTPRRLPDGTVEQFEDGRDPTLDD